MDRIGTAGRNLETPSQVDQTASSTVNRRTYILEASSSNLEAGTGYSD
jgi:hypothetical protein